MHEHTHIRTHTGDGKVPSSVANDLLMMCDDIGMGRVQRPDLVGKQSKAMPSTILTLSVTILTVYDYIAFTA